MGIPTLEIPQALVSSKSSEIAPLQDLAQAIRTALVTYPHFIVVTGYPATEDRTNLVNLAKAIGSIEPSQSASGFGRPGFSRQKQRKVSFTKVQINPAKANAGGGVTQYSRTHLPLSAHTDSSYMSRPHELVAFQCIVSDRAGGESIMIPAADLLPRLDRDVVELLRAPAYPFGNQPYPILAGEVGHEQIRYYRAQIDRILQAGAPPLSNQHLAAIESLDKALQQTEHYRQFQLQAGQIVLMHNHKVLHGRTGFSPESDRLLYRIRLHVDSLTTAAPARPSEDRSLTPGGTPIDNQDGRPAKPTPIRGDKPSLVFKLTQDGGIKAASSAAAHLNNQPVQQARAHLALAERLNRVHRFDEALQQYRQAMHLAPKDVAILNAYGKFLLRIGQFAEAIQVFRRCLQISPNDYDSGLALSSLVHAYGDNTAAQRILEQVVRESPYVFANPPKPKKPTVLRIRGLDGSAYGIVQQTDGTYKHLLRGGHFSIRDLVDKQRYNVIILNIFEDNVDTLKDLPNADLLLNTIACPDLKRSSLLAAARFADRHPSLPLINHPRRVLETTRERNALRLNLIPGVRFPKTERLLWDGVSLDAIVKEIFGLGFTFPMIIRLVGSQTGSSVALVKDEPALRQHFQQSSVNREYYIIQFHDCRNAQQIFNKTRVFFIDGEFYPVANLFHNDWNVHSGDRYQVMDKTLWTQEEEKSFLNDPISYIGQDNFNKLCTVRDIVGLDFFGIDLTILPDGTIFIFELNAAMRHNFDHAKNFPYTEPYLKKISAAFDAMIQSRLKAGQT
ncbi:MAG: TauD/TfdA family dioxygenase [Leptolyngbyaceae cyanobacterium MO_188.B28]|nr:TauD/TfdA family dioxygenase [Leptolyngbyaceae cyanobacterium MO_188.B28]